MFVSVLPSVLRKLTWNHSEFKVFYSLVVLLCLLDCWEPYKYAVVTNVSSRQARTEVVLLRKTSLVFSKIKMLKSNHLFS